MLLVLAREILEGTKTTKGANDWQERLEAWGMTYDDLLKERTYRTEIMASHRNWWYTHRNLRSSYRQLTKLLKDNQLFTYLDTSLTNIPIPRTTNYVEGGINSQLRTKLKLHRGMSQQHQIRLVDWYLYSRAEGQKPPRNFL